MQVLIDADGCPVVKLTAELCRSFHVPCIVYCDTSHEFHLEGTKTCTIDKGADSVDFALVNNLCPGDLVITQDYGLASMCLAKQARILHQDGWEYTEENIEALLFSRHESRKIRASGGRMKGPRKRTAAQDEAFRQALTSILQNRFQG